jgi:hypothetical protein
VNQKVMGSCNSHVCGPTRTTRSCDSHPHPPLIAPAVVALAAGGTAVPHARSRHNPSIQRLSLAYRAAIFWLSHCLWSARAVTTASVSWGGASKNSVEPDKRLGNFIGSYKRNKINGGMTCHPLLSSRVCRDHIVRTPAINRTFKDAANLRGDDARAPPTPRASTRAASRTCGRSRSGALQGHV